MSINRRKLLTLFGLGAVLGPSAVASTPKAASSHYTVDMRTATGAAGLTAEDAEFAISQLGLTMGEFVVNAEVIRNYRVVQKINSARWQRALTRMT